MGSPYYCKFAVQEIADTLAGTDKIVLIKPSKSRYGFMAWWCERLYAAGIKI
jgi:chorismate mutase